MWYFILKRLLLTIPTIFLALSVIFILTKSVTGDPVLFALQSDDFSSNQQLRRADAILYNQTARNLRLDKPVFYFSIIPANIPDSFFKLPPLQKKFAFEVVRKFGHPEMVLSLISKFELFLGQQDPEFSIHQNIIGAYSPDLKEILRSLKIKQDARDNQLLTDMEDSLDSLLSSPNRDLSVVPKIVIHGINNQFHHWVFNTLTFKFGYSIVDGQPAGRKIFQALRWTLVINLLSIFIGYLTAILIGVYAGWWGGHFDRFTSIIMYFVYSIPVFWLTTILVVFFTTNEYGSWTNIFPAAGIIKAGGNDSFGKILSQNAGLLIIPVLVLSTSLMAYIARIMRNSIVEEKFKSYVAHVRTKGLSERTILWKHVFRNASFPLITLVSSVLPASLAGSLVVEVICNLPGSGRLLYDAVQDKDWVIVNGVVMISALLTILGLLVSDILYRVVDPRVKWQQT